MSKNLFDVKHVGPNDSYATHAFGIDVLSFGATLQFLNDWIDGTCVTMILLILKIII
jgi:hypothetical protein